MASVFDRIDKIERVQKPVKREKRDAISRLDSIQPIDRQTEAATPVRTAGGGSTRNAAKEAREEQFAQKRTEREQAALDRKVSDYVSGLDQEQQDAYARTKSRLEHDGPSLLQRVSDTVIGGAKGALGADINAAAALYDAGQGARNEFNKENLSFSQHSLDRAKSDLAAMEEDNRKAPGTWSEKDLEQQRTVIQSLTDQTAAYGKVQRAQEGTARESYALADAAQESSAADIERAKQGLSKGGQIFVDAGASMTQTAMDAAANLLTGGVSMAPFAFRAFGGGTQQARQDNPGSTLGQQLAYGAASAAKEVFTEKMFNLALPFAKAYGGGALDDVVERGIRKAVDRFAKTDAGKRALGGALTFGAGAVSEGLEELIGDWMEWQMPRIYGGDVASAGKTLESSLYDFLVGAASGAMGGVISPGTYQYDIGNTAGDRQDAAMDNAYRAMSENGMFSREADAAREQARDSLGIPRRSAERQGYTAPAEVQNNAQDGDRALLETARSMTREQQETDSRNGQTAEQDESRIGRDIQDNMERVRRAAGALGESGGKALTAAYTEDTAKTIAPKEAVEGFYKVYNAALKGEQLADTDARSAAALPAHLRYAAQSAGQQDALRAKQAQFFGEKAGLVKDDSWKKAHLSSKTDRTLDALGKALGVQVQFAETVADGQANAQYGNGVITLALDAKDPVLTSVVHEAVHRIRETSPETYNTLAEFVQQTMTAEGLDFNLSERARLYGTENVSDLTEEMVADAFGRVLGNEDAAASLVQEHQNVAQKVMDVLRDIVNAVKRVLNHQNLELTAEQRAAFQDLEGRMGEMERLFGDALGKAALQTGTGNGTMNADENFFWEGKRNGRKGAPDAGTVENLQGEKRDRQQKAGGGDQRVRGELSDAAGRYGRVNPTFGAKPVRTWAEGHTVEPARGSVAYTEQQTAMEYGVPSFVVADEVWAKNKGNTPAFSADGQIYLRETLPERNRGMYAPHEVTHVMKQVGYQPYLDFVERTPTMLNMSDPATMLLLNHVAEHLHTTIEDADPTRLYDEFNATMYGHIAAGKTGMFTNGPAAYAFHDFDSYVKELTGVHEQFKAENEKGKKFSLKEYTAEEKKQHVKDAVAYFGRTFKWAETGYITTDGKRLDFSGRHEGGPGGYRTVDHRDIQDALGDDYGGDDHSGSMVQFMGEGNIRISPESGGINLSVMPTKAQLDTLSDFISKQRGEVILDLDTVDGNTVSSTEYPRGTHANKVLADIKAYFEEGKRPYVSEVSRFRYSLKDVSPVKPTSDDWKPGATFDEVKAAHPTLFALDADEADTRNPTQITGTVKSYRKIYDALQAENFDGTILDASSGLGYGTRAGREEYGFDVDDIEPFPDAKYQPNYTDYSTLDKTYDVIISNAVLNVMPQDLRDAMVVKIGEMLNPGGRAFINVRGTDVKNAGSKVAINDDLMEYFISNTGSYQKGFTSKELVSYLKDALGDGFTVEPTRKFGAVSAIVTRDGDRLSMDVNEKFSRSDRELLSDYVKKYGAIPRGEKPSREITMPKKTGDGKNLSQTVRTILEAGATPEAMVPNIEKLAARGDFSYDVYTDKQAISDAESQIKKVGWAQALMDWTKAVKSGEVSKANTAMGWALYNNAANSGDTKTALTVLNQMVEHQRSAAQALQATRILKSMSPETQLYGAQRSVENLQEELNKRYGDKKGPDLKIDEDLAERFMKAKDQESRDELLKEIYRDIGQQMPATFLDKWNAWRYLAMLGNPRTHIRNILGNLFFSPVVAAKDLTGTAIEAAVYRVSGGKLDRTKALVWGGKQDRALLSAAWGDYAKVQEAALGGGKYSDFANANKYIEEGRKIFNTKPLETFRKANSAALDKEDVWFSRSHYAYALSQYCKAHGITAEQIAGGKGLKAAREYAILEAQKATYRDTNALSQAISGLGRANMNSKNPVKKGIATLAEGILPFRKTPANILARGLEYSPLGLGNGIKEALVDVAKGDKTAAEAIDTISAGLTGTGLLMLGIYLASQGLVRGSGGDDNKKKKFEELQGHQDYALELPDGRSMTLDWLAPECLPFFVGVNLWENTDGKRATLSDWLTAASTVTDPLLSMSCLQSLNDVFDAVSNVSNGGLEGLPAALSSAATSYLTQALPTVLGQVERTGEDKRYTTYTEKNAFLTGDIQYTLGKASARIPGWDYQQIPYIDAWGRTEASGNAGTRAFNNFVDPAYTSQIQNSAMEKELLRLYEATGESGVFPQRAEKYFTVDQERKDLTAQEYVKYAELKGQRAYQLVTDLVKDKKYQAMSDQDKVAAVENTYKLANQQAKQKVGGYKPESWIIKAEEAEKKHGIDQETYILLKTQTAGIESLKDKDGETISNSKGLQIMELVYGYTGLSDKQKEAMFEYLGVGKTIRHYNPGKVKQELEKMKKK